MPRPRQSKFTRWGVAVLAVATAVVLTACGARIDTTMTVSATGAGTRVMDLTLASQDKSNLVGGVAAADASIRKHLPSTLSYSGLQPTSDGGLKATFTLAFDSTADYKKKATSLLPAVDGTDQQVIFSVSDSTLVKGITLEENYTSAGLLQWMFDGLVDDGVVAASNKSNMYQVGTSVLSFNGTSTQQSGVFQVEDVQNNGFDRVTMSTRIADLTHITRTITYAVTPDRYEANKAVLEKFIGEATPAGAAVETPSAGAWTLSFHGDAQAISADTKTALGGDAGSKFSLTLADASDPSEKTLTVTDNASCDAVCATDDHIIDNLTTASGYSPKRADIDTGSQTTTPFTYAPAITSVTSHIGFGLDGGVTGTFTFVVPKASTAAVGDGFAKRLRPAARVGTFDATKDSKKTDYVVTIRGKDAAAFAASLAEWAPDSHVSAARLPGSNWFIQNTGYTIAPGIASLIGNHDVTGKVTTEVALPLGQWTNQTSLNSHQTPSITGLTVSVTGAAAGIQISSSGPTIGGWILAVVLILIIAAGIYLLVRNRKTVLPWAAETSGRTKTALTDHQLTLLERVTETQPQQVRTGGSLLDLPIGQKARPIGVSLFGPAAPPPAAASTAAGSVFDLTTSAPRSERPSLFNIRSAKAKTSLFD